jgi:hypothetical protein
MCWLSYDFAEAMCFADAPSNTKCMTSLLFFSTKIFSLIMRGDSSDLEYIHNVSIQIKLCPSNEFLKKNSR